MEEGLSPSAKQMRLPKRNFHTSLLEHVSWEQGLNKKIAYATIWLDILKRLF
jgi:hypothetical protein